MNISFAIYLMNSLLAQQKEGKKRLICMNDAATSMHVI